MTVVYGVEVDVAIARPPTPANIRTVYVLVAVPANLPDHRADTEAQRAATSIALATHGWSLPRPVMPTATRIVSLEC